jgi:hypothetical protein
MARLRIVTSPIGRADSISSAPVPGNVRASFDLEGEQVRELGKVPLWVMARLSKAAYGTSAVWPHNGQNKSEYRV